MVLTTLYCEAVDCKHYNHGKCGLDFTTISINFECLGFESKLETKE